jgi:hypothetical protein
MHPGAVGCCLIGKPQFESSDRSKSPFDQGHKYGHALAAPSPVSN